MKKYVVGFLYNPELSKVVLIRKKRPDWQAGLLNGIGGKVEKDESPERAMKREFEEETGVILNWTISNLFAEIEGKTWIVYFYHMISDRFDEVKTMTDEEIFKYNLEDVYYDTEIIPNLKWLIPIILDCNHSFSKSYSK